MWTEQKQTFVEAAARVMWQEVYRAHARTKECVLCSHSAERHEDIRRFSSPLSPFAPPYDVMCRDCQAVNRNMDSIAHYHHATRFDDLTEMQQRTHIPLVPQYALFSAAELLGMLQNANGCELAVIIEAARKADECNSHDGLIDVAEFARLIALEAIGSGPRWTDEHSYVDLKVPRFDFKYQERLS